MSEEIENLHPLEIKALLGIPAGETPSEEAVARAARVDGAQCRRGLELLKTRGFVEVASEAVTHTVELSELGRGFLSTGLPEVLILRRADAEGGLTPAEIRQTPGLDPSLAGPAIGTLKKFGLADIYEAGLLGPVEGALEKAKALEALMARLSDGGLPLADLAGVERSYVEEKSRRRGKGNSYFVLRKATVRTYRLTESGNRMQDLLRNRGLTGDEITALTAEMVRDGTWKGKSFRRFNLELAPPRVQVGRKHPYRVFLSDLKARLVGLGFSEMRGSLTESEFWNMDALYMPQFHSARDIHDVYSVLRPARLEPADQPFLDRVARTHTDGGETGSTGWGYDFDADRSRRHIFRSHGTVLSARTLASGPDIPGKYFAVARCFRPEKPDATHAVDFFQVEGIVLGEEITFRTLLGLLELFAREIARAPEVKYTPAYFPFTEPSVEVHMRHPVLGWTELGGAGIFRPEVTHPLGVKVPVIAWGLGIDRMAMVALGINDIRDLFTRDLSRLRESRIPL
jgi:phenylalanyl-tRNA synthetase alpha chain